MGAKIVISPGQALLLLIDHYKDNERKANELKLLYLSGAINPRATEEIKTCLNDPFLSSWEIAFTPKIIDADPTRRYFETHLAHATLAYGLQDKDVKKEDLEKHIEALSNMIGGDTLRSVQHVLNGQYVNTSPLMHKEYADYISKINAGTIFQTFSANDRDVIALLVKSSFLGVVNAQVNKSLPLDLYGKGIYSDEKKGKQLHPDQVTTRSQHLGIMKGHMPLPQDDIARAEAAIGYLKPSDQAIYNENAAWVQGNFKRLVHPFSNSISGTMLCQLRSLARLHADHQQDPVKEAAISESSEQMSDFCRLFASAMLFGSGGHTLYEFTAPLSLTEVRDKFSDVLEYKDITMESMFAPYDDSTCSSKIRPELDEALQEAITYNNNVLAKATLHAEIREKYASFKDQVTIIKSSAESTEVSNQEPDHTYKK